MPAWPTLTAVAPPNSQVAAHLGDTLTFAGHHLDGTNHRLLLSFPRLRIEREVTPAASVKPDELTFVLPVVAADYPAGHWLAAVQLQRPSETQLRVSNQLALAIAPRMTTLTMPPQVFPRDGAGTAAVTIGCVPEVRPSQRASLIIGNREVIADDHPVTTGTLTFTVRNAPVGTHHVRLRVDGVDSELIDRAATPPAYLDHQIQIT
jgi:hypothetical protein